MSSDIFTRWAASQKPHSEAMRDAPAFYRNLEEALDVRRKDQRLYTLLKNTWAKGESADFLSNDTLSFGASGRLRKAFDEELSRHSDAQIGAGGSRLMGGNYDYIETVEREIADYHGVEAALLVSSGCDANSAILEAIPRPGDAIVYDELVHASILGGISRSLAGTKVAFAHNDVDALREILVSIRTYQPLIEQGKNCVLIAVESFYSLEGDVSPLKEFVQLVKEIFPFENAQFIVDEAHSMGVVGEKGLGFVNALGLDGEIAIKSHTFGKAFGSIGGVVLGNHIVKNALVNFSRETVNTSAPAFHQVAGIRAGYTLMSQPETQAARNNIQHLAKRFFAQITAHPVWKEAHARDVISIPAARDWENRDILTQFIPLCTREQDAYWLAFWLDGNGYSVFPVAYPVGEGRAKFRIVLHANHSLGLVDGLVRVICGWVEVVLRSERGRGRGMGNGDGILNGKRGADAVVNEVDR